MPKTYELLSYIGEFAVGVGPAIRCLICGSLSFNANDIEQLYCGNCHVFHQREELASLELYAWVGEDELGSGEIGLKQADVPAGRIALVSIERKKIERLLPQMEAQARAWGKRIRLCRFKFVDVVAETKAGK